LLAAGGLGARAQSANETSDADLQPAAAPGNSGRIATLDPSDLRDFDAQPPAVRRLLTEALRLTKLKLVYRYGSDDPAAGGMDCSGTIYYLLRYSGVADPPRDSSQIYRWLWTQGRFESVVSSSPDTFELSRLKPGDLLFWTGTYHVTRDPPVTHVMIYLGIDRRTGERVMMGASEGRRFEGVSRYGVSVFDFVIPRAGQGDAASGDPSRFIGYGAIPGLKDAVAPSDGNGG
jgi:cell wall-associated NlpC family hydrolase